MSICTTLKPVDSQAPVEEIIIQPIIKTNLESTRKEVSTFKLNLNLSTVQYCILVLYE